MSDNIYRTSDFYLSAFLLSQGLTLLDVGHNNPKRLEFVFQDRPDRPQLVHDFLCGTATGNLADFVYQLRRAKRLQQEILFVSAAREGKTWLGRYRYACADSRR